MTQACGCGCEHGAKTLTIERRERYTGEERVGDVARQPEAFAVLERHGVNHCCGAHLSLREGAAAAGVPLETLLAALEAATGR